MIRRLLCWLGWHEWCEKEYLFSPPDRWYFNCMGKPILIKNKVYCKHCGRTKK